MRRANGAAALEHVKIPRLGWSLSAAAFLTVASATAAIAQDVRPDTTTRSDSSTHTVKRGDTLWDLANAYLGDAYLWPEIYRLNTDLIDDPHWIYPGDVLKLPGRVAPEVAAAPGVTPPTPGRPPQETFNPRAEQELPPHYVPGPTIFRAVQRSERTRSLPSPPPLPRVPFGDVTRAPYFDRQNGPRGTGRVIVGYDLPGANVPPQTTNFQLYDKVLMTPPDGSIGAEGERYVAYELGPYVEDIGSVVVPVAILRVVRAPRNGEAAVAEVVEMYSRLDADVPVVPLETGGAGATAKPIAVASKAGRTATIRVIHRPAVLPSLDYYVLFDLTAGDGMRIGDEVEIFRPRQNRVGDDGPVVPEVSIATGQVVRVTPYGATARVTSQEQPAIREGQSVRVVARMP